MRDLTPTEISDIKAEIAIMGDVDSAVRFCCGYKKVIGLTEDEYRTIALVKQQVFRDVEVL